MSTVASCPLHRGFFKNYAKWLETCFYDLEILHCIKTFIDIVSVQQVLHHSPNKYIECEMNIMMTGWLNSSQC